MKKHLLFLFTALLPLVASAEKVEIDGIWYNLVSKVKQAEVTFKGDSYDSYRDEYSGSITIPATVTHNGVEYSVTSIGDKAFRDCSSLTAITLPESVTSIGEYAFRGCRDLTAITIPENSKLTSIGRYAFSGCSSLTTITLPESVTSIGNYAFSGCSRLTTITLPESVTSIGEYAFQSCRSLTDITIPEGVTSIGWSTFDGCSSLTAITLPKGVTSIGNYAFRGCSSLTAITIPESVTSIGLGAFQSCSSLTAITIPEGVTSIGNHAFYSCSSLTAITIPESVTSIGESAFSGCSSLTAITIPKSVKYIGSNAFANCPELTDVYCYAERVPSTSADAFDGSFPEYATLHVPAGAMNDYKTTAPWSSFGTIKTIENVTLEKCATPTINYKDGKVVFACDTEGAIVKSSFKDNSASDYNDMEVAFIPTYTLTAYATKEGYEDSDEVTLALCWIPCEEDHEENNGIITIPAKPVLISTQGSTITVSGLAEGTEVAVVTTGGTTVATATATDGTATLATSLEAGSIAIVKMGNYSIRIAIK